MNKIYACSNCGVCLTNRNDWCDIGCGRDYNEMIEVCSQLDEDGFCYFYCKKGNKEYWWKEVKEGG
uniref:Uncharacterized protein n=1 Tax=viral metagenome TaxID=1070528 RepID=A0A6H1Z633_9ZZZZ